MSATVVTKTEPIVQRLALIGTGLIGGSIARAARASGAAKTIVATARSAETRKRVAELGFADQVAETNAQAVKDADLVIVSIPVGACGAVAKEIGPHLKPGAILSDVGSVKGSVVRDMAPYRAERRAFHSGASGRGHGKFRPGFRLCRALRQSLVHPHAGRRHRSGGDEKLSAFWSAIGANVETMTPDHHDLVLAVTSHLPHLIAYTIVGTADELGDVTRIRSAEILRRRLSRLHPHRGVRSDHVARRVPAQQGRRAGNARHLQ